MRDARLPSAGLSGTCAAIAGLAGLLAAILVFVAETWAMRAGLGVGALAAFVIAGGLGDGAVWGAPAFSVVSLVASAFLWPRGEVFAAFGLIGAVLAIATSWNFVRVSWRMKREGLDRPPMVEVPAEPTRFTSHVHVQLWIVVAILGVIAAIVVPLLLRR